MFFTVLIDLFGTQAHNDESGSAVVAPAIAAYARAGNQSRLSNSKVSVLDSFPYGQGES